MENKVEIYKTKNGAEVTVKLENDTVWLDAHTIASIFGVNRPAIVKHIGNIYKIGELEEIATCSKMEQVASDGKRRVMNFYNLDMILSVGYRVNSIQATKFRQWTTQRLKDYLVQGYAINEKRLAQKNQEVEHLKAGIRILNRAIEQQATVDDSQMLRVFARGLSLLDDYDHQTLETKGRTVREAVYPTFDQYMELIKTMYSDFASDVFAQPKDESFHSSINQIAQSFGGVELYPSIEEKGANLLYYITKNHSFVDGNKRIAAACFLLFMEKNNALFGTGGSAIISNEALAALTLFIATSKTEEIEEYMNEHKEEMETFCKFKTIELRNELFNKYSKFNHSKRLYSDFREEIFKLIERIKLCKEKTDKYWQFSETLIFFNKYKLDEEVTDRFKFQEWLKKIKDISKNESNYSLVLEKDIYYYDWN